MHLQTLISLYLSSRLLHTQTLAYQSSYSENIQLVFYFSLLMLYHDIPPPPHAHALLILYTSLWMAMALFRIASLL